MNPCFFLFFKPQAMIYEEDDKYLNMIQIMIIRGDLRP